MAIVTGGGRGIGQGIALVLAKQGADLVVVSRTLAEIEETVAKVRERGRKAIAIKCDLSKLEDTNKMVNKALEQFGKIDILVNNAGVYPQDKATFFYDLTEEDWHYTIECNLYATINCCRAVIKHMMERKTGKIVNMSSLAATEGGVPKTVIYGASKAGIVAFTKGLAKEVANYGINVNVIAPGRIDHPRYRKFLVTVYGEAVAKERLAKLPGLPSYGKPEDVGNLVAFLVSEEALYISGQYHEMGVLR